MSELPEGHCYGDGCPDWQGDDHGSSPEASAVPAVSDVGGSTGRVGTSDRAGWSDADLGDVWGGLRQRIAEQDAVPPAVIDAASGALRLSRDQRLAEQEVLRWAKAWAAWLAASLVRLHDAGNEESALFRAVTALLRVEKEINDGI